MMKTMERAETACKKITAGLAAVSWKCKERTASDDNNERRAE